MAKKAKIELELDAKGMSKTLTNLVDQFDNLQESAEATGKALPEKELGTFGKALDKVKKQLKAFKKDPFGQLKKGVDKVVGGLKSLAKTAAGAAAATGLLYAGLTRFGKTTASELRGVYDPLVAGLEQVDRKARELKGTFGDLNLATELAIKQAMLPALENMKKKLQDNKLEAGQLLLDIKKFAKVGGAVIIEGLGFAFVWLQEMMTKLPLQFEKMAKELEKRIIGFTVKLHNITRGIPGLENLFFISPEESKANDAAWKKASAGIHNANIQIANATKKADGYRAAVQGYAQEYINMIATAGGRLGAIQKKAGDNQFLSLGALTKRLNTLRLTISGDLQKAFEASFLSGTGLEQMKQSQLELEKIIIGMDRLAYGITELEASADQTAFNKLHADFQKLAATITGNPIKLNFDSTQADQKVLILRAAFEALQKQGELTMQELSLAMAKLGDGAASAAEDSAAKMVASWKNAAVTIYGTFLTTFQGIGEAFGEFAATFNDKNTTMIEKQKALFKSLGASFLGIVESMMQQVLQMHLMKISLGVTEAATSEAVKDKVVGNEVEKASAKGVSAAAGGLEALSSVSFIGPALGIAAALMILGFVKSMIGGMAEGGYVPGSWGAGAGSRSDTVPKFLTPGEYVMPVDEQKGLRRLLGGVAPSRNRALSGNVQNITLSFSSTLPTNRIQAKKIMQRDVVPLLRSLQSGGY